MAPRHPGWSVGQSAAESNSKEWQTDSLAAASTTNAQLEGDEVSGSTSAPTTRAQNTCQISRKDAVVTGTQEDANPAGRKSEMAYQMAKRSKELKRDMESILTGNQGATTGATTTARTLRSLCSWLDTNTSFNSTTSNGAGADSTGQTQARTDSTGGQRAFTEAILKTVLRLAYAAGGNPNVLMVGPVNKQKVSDFTGRTSARQMIDAEKIQAAADMYASDFGDLKVVPNRFQRERDAFVIDPEYAAVSYFRPFKQFPLAKVGDSERRVILVEYTLEMRNEAAHGGIFDLTTS